MPLPQQRDCEIDLIIVHFREGVMDERDLIKQGSISAKIHLS